MHYRSERRRARRGATMFRISPLAFRSNGPTGLQGSIQLKPRLRWPSERKRAEQRSNIARPWPLSPGRRSRATPSSSSRSVVLPAPSPPVTNDMIRKWRQDGQRFFATERWTSLQPPAACGQSHTNRRPDHPPGGSKTFTVGMFPRYTCRCKEHLLEFQPSRPRPLLCPSQLTCAIPISAFLSRRRTPAESSAKRYSSAILCKFASK